MRWRFVSSVTCWPSARACLKCFVMDGSTSWCRVAEHARVADVEARIGVDDLIILCTQLRGCQLHAIRDRIVRVEWIIRACRDWLEETSHRALWSTRRCCRRREPRLRSASLPLGKHSTRLTGCELVFLGACKGAVRYVSPAALRHTASHRERPVSMGPGATDVWC